MLALIAASGKFDVFLTVDKSLPHQQQLKAVPFAVVILRAVSNSFEDTRPLMPEFLRRLDEFKADNAYVLTLPE